MKQKSRIIKQCVAMFLVLALCMTQTGVTVFAGEVQGEEKETDAGQPQDVFAAKKVELSDESGKWQDTVSGNDGEQITADTVYGADGVSGNVLSEEVMKSDTSVKLALSNPIIDAKGNVTWDCIYFGEYPQTDKTGETAEPIKWRVLQVNGDDVLVQADVCLDCQEYNDASEKKFYITWESCSLRKWLNETFIEKAFSPEEQQAMIETTIENPDNPIYDTEGGEATTDKVFLLSLEEAMNPEYGFSAYVNEKSETRMRKNTAYAIEQGAYTDKDTGTGWAWLRSPGIDDNNQDYVAGIEKDGSIRRYGWSATSFHQGVCPAMHLKLQSLTQANDAGTVTSTGGTAKVTPEPVVPVKKDGELSNPTVSETGVVTWDCIYFGNYPQTDPSGDCTEPIKWRVLQVSEDGILVQADKILDCRMYAPVWSQTSWEKCDLRKWLNDIFLNRAFNDREKHAIIKTRNKNDPNPVYNRGGCNDTEDSVFLLSTEESVNTEYGFSAYPNERSDTRKREITPYAKAQGVEIHDGCNEGTWWLRSPGVTESWVASVWYRGTSGRYGSIPNDVRNGICPVLRLDPASTVYSYGGTVTSDGGTLDEAVPEPAEPVQKEGALANPTISENGVVTWDCIYFGNYPQSDRKGEKEEPIKWRVLQVNGNDALIQADKNLDCKPYNVRGIAIWEFCSLRTWLNDTFLNRAFDEKEQNAIIETTNDTIKDKISLLSIEDAKNGAYGYFIDCGESYRRERESTAYAKAQGIVMTDDSMTGQWWLYSQENESNSAAYITGNGAIYERSEIADCDGIGVCPVLHLNLKSAVYSYAGTVTSQSGNVTKNPGDGESGTVTPGDGEPGTVTPGDGEGNPDQGNFTADDFNADDGKQTVRISAIRIQAPSGNLAAGQKVRFCAKISPENASDKSVTWSSSNKKYATVDARGKVSFKKAGAGKRVTITATANDGSGIRAFYRVKIMKHAVKKIKLSASKKTVKAGKSVNVKASVTTTGKKANKTLVWKSSNKKYATVDAKGKVKTKAAGKGKRVTITAAATDGTGKKATITIRIK